MLTCQATPMQHPLDQAVSLLRRAVRIIVITIRVPMLDRILHITGDVTGLTNSAIVTQPPETFCECIY